MQAIDISPRLSERLCRSKLDHRCGGEAPARGLERCPGKACAAAGKGAAA